MKSLSYVEPKVFRALEELDSLLSRLSAEQQAEFFDGIIFCTREFWFDEHGVGRIKTEFVNQTPLVELKDNEFVGIEDPVFRAKVLNYWEKKKAGGAGK